MTIWAIWKSRNKKVVMIRMYVAPNGASNTLRELIRDLRRVCWDATRFIEGGRRTSRRRTLKTLWVDGCLAVFDPKIGPIVNLA